MGISMKYKALLLLCLLFVTGCFPKQQESTLFDDEFTFRQIEEIKTNLLGIKEAFAISLHNEETGYQQSYDSSSTVLTIINQEHDFKYVNEADITSHYQIVDGATIFLDSYEETHDAFYNAIHCPIDSFKTIFNSIRSGRFVLHGDELGLNKDECIVPYSFLALQNEIDLTIPFYERSILVESISSLGVKSNHNTIYVWFEGIVDGIVSEIKIQGRYI